MYTNVASITQAMVKHTLSPDLHHHQYLHWCIQLLDSRNLCRRKV